MRESKLAWNFLMPALFFLLIISLVPTLYIVGYSLTDYIAYKPGSIDFIHIKNYFDILFKDGKFYNSLKNTLFFMGGSLLVEIPLGFLIALLLDNIKRGATVFRVAFLLPMFVTPIVVSFIWKMLLNPSLGALNYFLGLLGIGNINWLGSIPGAMLSMIMVDVWQWTPLAALVFLAGLQSVPQECLEAAEVDGASFIGKTRHITIPILKNITIILIIIRIIWLLRTFDTIYVMTDGGPASSTTTLGYYIY
ncbi:MAG: sugar ABC transporter permease, partial [Actinobacteria bacterium]|nr:sugar ABC transporter permease [Actinomycetota bacterium]